MPSALPGGYLPIFPSKKTVDTIKPCTEPLLHYWLDLLSVGGSSAWGETEQDAEKEIYKVLGLYGDTFQVFRNQYVKVESNKDEVYRMLDFWRYIPTP